ncbi:MAG: hypothetical protein HYU66_04990, partial [Armatimonadetes bacterium]|nr:hypothetical protein [Armatimonadota bacterium]
MLALWVVTSLTAPPTAEQARAILGRSIPDAIAEFQAWDLGQNGGRGNSDQTDSGGLGWGESSYLTNYMHCFHATGDPYWLDKVVDHTDRLLAGQHEADGFRVWDDIRYSVGIVRVTGSTDAEGLALTPPETRENVTRHGAVVTGHQYTLDLPTADTVRVTDLTTGQVVVEAAYAGKLAIDLFGAKAAAPGDAALKDAAAPLTLSGPGRASAKFTIDTLAPERIQFVVHDGMVTYPIAQFIEAVRADPALAAKYGAKADAYLAWFRRHVHDKWERFWHQVDGDTGAYTFTHQVTERFPGYLLPHNQFLALGRAYLVLQAVPGVANAAEYRRKVECMARYFQRYLRPADEGRAYVWNYWDPPAGEEVRRYVEDYSHATIDVGFVVEAARRGVVFTPDDTVKIARTYTDVMGNGDLEHPAVAGRVDGQGGFKERIWHDWCLTGLYDERAFAFAVKMAGGTATAWPELCDLAAALGAVTEDDRQA